MKKQTYRLSIPEPCHEGWDAMTANERGRFCSSCQKTVIDFTCKSDKEIIDAMKAGGGCGRFLVSQVNEPLIISEASSIPLWKAAAVAAISLFAIKQSVAHSFKKTKSSSAIQSTPKPGLFSKKKKDKNPVDDKICFEGMVLDEYNKQPVKNVNISVKNDTVNIQAITDSLGRFDMVLPNICGLKLTASSGGRKVELNLEIFDIKTIYLPSATRNLMVTNISIIHPTLTGDYIVQQDIQLYTLPRTTASYTIVKHFKKKKHRKHIKPIDKN